MERPLCRKISSPAIFFASVSFEIKETDNRTILMPLKETPAPWAAGKAKERGVTQGLILSVPDGVFI